MAQVGFQMHFTENVLQTQNPYKRQYYNFRAENFIYIEKFEFQGFETKIRFFFNPSMKSVDENKLRKI